MTHTIWLYKALHTLFLQNSILLCFLYLLTGMQPFVLIIFICDFLLFLFLFQILLGVVIKISLS